MTAEAQTGNAHDLSSVARLPAAQRRGQLFEIALEIFSVRGYHGTAMEEIAEAAGVTKPVLYQHFASKRALYMELLEHVGEEMMAVIADAVSRAESPRRQVESGFAAYFRYVDKHQNGFYLLFGTGGRGDDEFGEVSRKVEGLMAASVATLIEAGLEPEHQLMLAYGIVGLAESTSRQWLASRGEPGGAASTTRDPETLARWMSDLAWAGLRGVHRD